MRAGVLSFVCLLVLSVIGLTGQDVQSQEESKAVPAVTEAHTAAFAKVQTITVAVAETYDKKGEDFEVGVSEALSELLVALGRQRVRGGEADAELLVVVSAEPTWQEYEGGGKRITLYSGGEAQADVTFTINGCEPLQAAFRAVKPPPTLGDPASPRTARGSPAWHLARRCALVGSLRLLVQLDTQRCCALLEHGNPELRMCAAKALVDVGPLAVPSLTTALGDENAGVRERAAYALGAIGAEAKSAVPALAEALKDGQARVRRRAADALRAVADGSAPAAVEPEWDEEPPELFPERKAGPRLRAPERSGPRTSQSPHQPPPEVADAVPALIDALKDEDAQVRWRAAEALGAIRQASVPALMTALKAEQAEVRWRAADALGMMGSAAKDAVPSLVEALHDESWLVRERAAHALGEIGPEAEAAVPALVEARSGDQHFAVCSAAGHSVTKIQSESKKATPEPPTRRPTTRRRSGPRRPPMGPPMPIPRPYPRRR